MEHGGHRLTPQRREVYEVFLAGRDHPTAKEVFIRAKGRMPTISLATVYNCLETLLGSGLVRQVNVEREATRYCPNLEVPKGDVHAIMGKKWLWQKHAGHGLKWLKYGGKIMIQKQTSSSQPGEMGSYCWIPGKEVGEKLGWMSGWG
ncbi:MAG: hypothetical protein Fur0032_16250 [Terrimicrobiaceae bacterium]